MERQIGPATPGRSGPSREIGGVCVEDVFENAEGRGSLPVEHRPDFPPEGFSRLVDRQLGEWPSRPPDLLKTWSASRSAYNLCMDPGAKDPLSRLHGNGSGCRCAQGPLHSGSTLRDHRVGGIRRSERTARQSPPRVGGGVTLTNVERGEAITGKRIWLEGVGGESEIRGDGGHGLLDPAQSRDNVIAPSGRIT